MAHRGRLCRFGFDWFEHLMAIVHAFSCPCTGCTVAGNGSAISRKMAKVHKVTCLLRSDDRHRLAAVRDRHAAMGSHRKDRARGLLYRVAHAVVDKADSIVCKDPTARMKSARYRHKDTNRRLHSRVRGVMAETLTSDISTQRF
ncbi:MAG: hypothetical protein OXG36_17645 [Caldilineaceae bacterium]|nr:hypothetical protein [Caldilineaceae bacterium]